MCDSIEVDFLIDHPNETDLWPFVISSTCDHNGEERRQRSPQKYVTSPLTGARFIVTAILTSNATTGKYVATGYRVSVNVPACLIGNNAILTNDVPSAVEAAYRLLKHHLVNERIDVNLLAKISLERAIITSVTPTFLFRLSSEDKARSMNDKFYRRAHALLKMPTGAKSKAPVRIFASGKCKTIYVTPSREDYEITAYVKSGPNSNSFNSFPSSELQDQVYQESGKLLRVEIKLNKRWLKSNKLDTFKAWQGVKEFTVEKQNDPALLNPYQRIYQLIRDVLRLNDNLRLRAPRAQDLKGLPESQQSIVRAHINGQDYKSHPALKDKHRVHDWRLKKKILETLRIDLSIPWAVQRDDLSQELVDVLSWDNRRKVPRPLADVCLSRQSTEKKLAELDALLESRIKQSGLTRLELIKKLAGPPAGHHPTSQQLQRSSEPTRASSAAESPGEAHRGDVFTEYTGTRAQAHSPF